MSSADTLVLPVGQAPAAPEGAEPRRETFFAPGEQPGPGAAMLLELLRAQDGSTTRLCETIAGAAVQVRLHGQRLLEPAGAALPAAVRRAMPGDGPRLERLTTLAAHGQAMMDNLSIIAPDHLPPDVRADLDAGVLPIGHLLARLWVRRVPLAGPAAEADELLQRLWARVGLPDPAASRAYAITSPDGVVMVIAESFRRGMRMRRAAQPPEFR